MRSPLRRYKYLLLLLLFVAALLPRALYPVSRPLQWYERSYRFVDAVLQRQWAYTVVSEHPGVTPMWLIGLTQHVYEALRRGGGDRSYSLPDIDRAFLTEVSACVWALATAISLGIPLAWYALKRLFGEPVAWAGAGLIALDPFQIANSKVVHIDGVLSMLMLLSALLLLVHLRRARAPERPGMPLSSYRLLVVSGVLGGLAFLTKSPAYYLVPFLGLSLLITRKRAPIFRAYILPAAVWLASAAVTYVICWPAMWVEPIRTLATVFRGVALHTGRAHPQPLYYMGELVTGDPGIGYYLTSIVVKTTLVTLALFVVGAIGIIRLPGRAERDSALLLASYTVFFVIQMALGAKKAPRYLLPVFPALGTLAGLGLVRLARCAESSRSRLRPPALVLAALATQGALVLSYHPYYVAHANLLVGGNRGARDVLLGTPQGEGLDLVAEYLNGLPGAAHMRVGVQLPAREALQQRFAGQTLDTREPDLDYLVFAEVYVRRGLAQDQWGGQWDEYRYRAPDFVARIRGEPYAWVFAVENGPRTPAEPLNVCVGDHIRLLGYTLVEPGATLPQGKATPGDDLLITLHWKAVSNPKGDYSVFVHLLGPDGSLVDQQDNVPLQGRYPVALWEPEEQIDDPYEVSIPRDAPSGTYRIVAGMYEWRTGRRLPLSVDCERAVPGNQATLTMVTAAPPRMPWWQVPVWLLALSLVVAGVLCTWRQRGLPNE